MSTATRASQEYRRLVGQWELRIKPELSPGFAHAPIRWREKLPFTYVFDRFCHFLEAEADPRDYPALAPSNTAGRQEYFRDFVRGLPDIVPLDELSRTRQLEASRRIDREGVQVLSDQELRAFFLRLHAVKYGSGAGRREDVIFRTARNDPNRLRDLVELLRDENLPIEERIQYALMDPGPNGKGKRIKYLGPSCIGEIPGWLIHAPQPCDCKYPIVNGKFVRALYRLGIYNRADLHDSCFTTEDAA